MSLNEFPKEIAWRILRHPERVEKIKVWNDVWERLKMLDEVLLDLNITKWQMHEIESEIWNSWVRRVIYLVQASLETNLWLCKWFRTFYSKRNHKYHDICRYTEGNVRTICQGEISRCTQWFFQENNWVNLVPEIPKIPFNKL